jgi:thioredoxin reductase (NADPH)
MDTLIAILITALISSFFLWNYMKGLRDSEARAKAAAEKGKLYSHGPRAQHPHIDISNCIGCGSCTSVCPEGDVLGMLGGKAAIINAHKCIGHSLCAEACPVGAITMVMAAPGMSADMPRLSPEFETTVPNLFIVGELGGLALIKNAVNQGRECVDTIVRRLQSRSAESRSDIYDVLIIGAGPAGISASLRAIECQLNYMTLERDEVGGTVAKYPRQKLVMTSPVDFPLYGKFKKTELSKEHLLAFWDMVLNRSDFNVRTGEAVENIVRGSDGILDVVTASNHYSARAVILALGRTGTPRKLDVPGEDLPKVMYRLIEADHYVNKHILVVGGGDSAVEAAMGLASQPGNNVTLSYRQASLSRIKDRNAKRIDEFIRKGQLRVLFESNVVEIKVNSVVLSQQQRSEEIKNDFVWVFAGGVPPNDFLRKIGVGFGAEDMLARVDDEKRIPSFSAQGSRLAQVAARS